MSIITVYIDSDPASLGADADQADLDTYATNLATHLSKRFGVDIEIEPVLGGSRGGRQCSDDSIEEYMRELEGGDGWVELLDEAAPGADPEPEWDYEGYWNAVLGAHLTPRGVLRLFELEAADEAEITEWLVNVEREAHDAGVGRRGTYLPPEWVGFRARALAQLVEAAEAASEES